MAQFRQRQAIKEVTTCQVTSYQVTSYQVATQLMVRIA